MNIFIITILILIICLMLLFVYDEFYIPVYDEFYIPVYDNEEAVYNIGDLFNTPCYWTGGNYPIKKLRPEHQVRVDFHKNTIADIYFSSRPEEEDIPNEPRICSSTDEYINRNGEKFQDLMNIVSNKKTLTAHVRSGDLGVISGDLVSLIAKTSADYDKVFILSGIHSDKNWFSNIENPKSNLNQSLDMIKNSLGDKAIFDFSEADVHLCLMRKSSNLFLHKGGFSMLGGILFQGNNLYVSPYFEAKDKPEYMPHLSKEINIILL